ncbi:bacteriohemerythrin [Trichlorobacter thiogenes]|nr:bacteriohemerythrin [Trichlorobacter thiogenes]
MALIEWNQSLKVDIQQFDDQHQQLVAMVNRLHQALKDGQAVDLLDEILAGLLEYTQVHFAGEEALMEQYGYPDYQRHKQTHVDLVRQVEDIYAQFKNGKQLQPISVMQFLVNWLTNHIKGEDKKYTSFFKGKGIE